MDKSKNSFKEEHAKPDCGKPKLSKDIKTNGCGEKKCCGGCK